MLSFLVILAVSATAVQAGKRGLAWTWFNSDLDPGVFNTGSGEVVAIYDYETYAPPSTNSSGGLNFIGMQRCTDCDSSPIADLASRQADQGWNTVFTLNEPDMNSISASDAASWYIEYISPLTIKKALPAVTSSTTSGEGLSWLSAMISACESACDADYINLHWYGSSFTDFQSYIENAISEFPDYEVVITEFALTNPSGGESDQLAFFSEAFAWLDTIDTVVFYFPFLSTTPSLLSANDASSVSYVGTGSCLFNDDGTPSSLGNLML
ncbi:uncharacterized protein STEHIDRAFT_100928 [Stereum hirsutum FP-91666 SS1]|uniref:uncharacterized protein n=1 Tax=Stereum hirsutum (strain FP-91666) TaxID=721885 RepID=UPI000444935A|nr:uncharacterized protein STEHIDRAFT_100928 [Stereum hirsutum FP-91666 SS1]EIM83901.1 hypothetical protein STEHIDRAFT_100928 [Stereum hirsutum FP-91666 SS1]